MKIISSSDTSTKREAGRIIAEYGAIFGQWERENIIILKRFIFTKNNGVAEFVKHAGVVIIYALLFSYNSKNSVWVCKAC